jgi:hypothetical protein
MLRVAVPCDSACCGGLLSAPPLGSESTDIMLKFSLSNTVVSSGILVAPSSNAKFVASWSSCSSSSSNSRAGAVSAWSPSLAESALVSALLDGAGAIAAGVSRCCERDGTIEPEPASTGSTSSSSSLVGVRTSLSWSRSSSDETDTCIAFFACGVPLRARNCFSKCVCAGVVSVVLRAEPGIIVVTGKVVASGSCSFWISISRTTSVSSSSSGGCTLFLGRPLRLLGGASVSTSAALDSAGPKLTSLDFDLGAFLTGVPLRLGFAVVPTSDFLGRPRGRLAGVCASGSFSGTVVVFVLVTRCIDGEFSSLLSGSACTVTLMRHGLAPPILGVFMIIDLAGDKKSSSAILDLRFCLLGEVAVSGSLKGAWRMALLLLLFVERANGSGLESQLRSLYAFAMALRPRDVILKLVPRNV